MSIVTKMQIIAFVIIIVMGAIILDRDSFGIFLIIMFVLVAGLMVKHLYKDHKLKNQLEENKDRDD